MKSMKLIMFLMILIVSNIVIAADKDVSSQFRSDFVSRLRGTPNNCNTATLQTDKQWYNGKCILFKQSCHGCTDLHTCMIAAIDKGIWCTEEAANSHSYCMSVDETIKTREACMQETTPNCGKIDLTLTNYDEVNNKEGFMAYAFIEQPRHMATTFYQGKAQFARLPQGTYTVSIAYENDIFKDADTKTVTIPDEKQTC